jgi:hypothetical protein
VVRKLIDSYLQQCVSSRAKLAIGVITSISLDPGFSIGDTADFVVFGNKSASASFRSMKSTQDLIYNASYDRITIFRGTVVIAFDI